MSYTSTHFMFRSLDDAEVAEFQAYARTTPPDVGSWHVLHPVCRLVWLEQGIDGCPDAECTDCAVAYCPHGEPLHLHHDGCPACDMPDAGLSEERSSQGNGNEG